VSAFVDAFRSKRVGLLVALGFASGLPLALTGTTLSAWMTNEGVDLKTIGLFGLVALPYNFKFVWAPLFDRFVVPWLGRRRGWMACTQLGLVGAIAVMGGVNPRAAPFALAALAVLVAFLSASQDIVSDAYRTDVLPETERASGTATFVLGYRAAMLVSGAFALILSARLPWQLVYWVMAALMAVGVAASWVAPEPETVRPPRTLGAAVVEPFVDYFARRGALVTLAFIALYKLGDSLASGMITPFLLKTGFGNAEVGALQKGLGLGATIVGTLLGGGLVAKLGVRRSLLWFGVAQAATNVTYMALALVGKSYWVLAGAITVDNVCGGLGTAAFVAYLMSLCNRRFSATQYALLSSASTVAGRLIGASAGFAAERFGWPVFFGGTIAAAAPALLLLVLAMPDGTGAPPPPPPVDSGPAAAQEKDPAPA
jgi:PAT family beta-lactamase induction signal transducer AmpG